MLFTLFFHVHLTTAILHPVLVVSVWIVLMLRGKNAITSAIKQGT